ncbi:hypothetical protein SYNPS1DRAFT_27992 [Syncephalis pseudoplumigaleata]|uniref:Uncharacterized protein n=1 Tax=Syncephalis pseudoplumigaleata TaxID=1712513 RepID=A0A4V1J1U8_9FUNG|nr:hypothetical protein SYNPS1DRAFT_27992 [Syncephalis pseudoplumigaleata]|eukprot:RKP26309.1 hypothetical protein SYNPS1DRAFT_27992 [Syncephalis pseudoplumigaleata]
MPDRLPGHVRERSALSSNASSESASSSSASRTKERHQHTIVQQHRTVRFSEDLYMHQRSFSVDGTDLPRETGSLAMPHEEQSSSSSSRHVLQHQHQHQQHSLVATASHGIYHSFAPLFREKGLRELAETRSAVGVPGEASAANRPRILHSSSTVSMPAAMTTAVPSRTKDAECPSNGHGNVHGRQRARSQPGATTRNRTGMYTSPMGSRHATRPTSPLLESPPDMGDRVHYAADPLSPDGQSREADEKDDDMRGVFGRDRSSLDEELPPRSIVLQPNDSRHAAQLATLFSTNHTLSPYTRPVGHFATRSTLGAARSTADAQARASRRTVVGKFHLPWNIAGASAHSHQHGSSSNGASNGASSSGSTAVASPASAGQEPRPRRSTHAAITTTTTMTTTHIHTISPASLSANQEATQHASGDRSGEYTTSPMQRHASDGDSSVRGALLQQQTSPIKSPILGPLGMISSGIGRMPILATRRMQTATGTDAASPVP